MKTGLPRIEAIVELIAHDLAGPRLQVDQARRPRERTGPGEDAFMGFSPPWGDRRPASQVIGQLPKCRTIRIRPGSKQQRLESRVARVRLPVLPHLQLLGPTLRVTAETLAASLGLA